MRSNKKATKRKSGFLAPWTRFRLGCDRGIKGRRMLVPRGGGRDGLDGGRSAWGGVLVRSSSVPLLSVPESPVWPARLDWDCDNIGLVRRIPSVPPCNVFRLYGFFFHRSKMSTWSKDFHMCSGCPFGQACLLDCSRYNSSLSFATRLFYCGVPRTSVLALPLLPGLIGDEGVDM